MLILRLVNWIFRSLGLIDYCRGQVCLYEKKKKTTTIQKVSGSSSSSFDAKRFFSVKAEIRFHELVKNQASLKEQDFEIKSPHLENFEIIITRRGWQEFCKPPKVAVMTIVHEVYTNACESPVSTTMV